MAKCMCGKCGSSVSYVVVSEQYFPLISVGVNKAGQIEGVEFGDLDESYDRDRWVECPLCGRIHPTDVKNG